MEINPDKLPLCLPCERMVPPWALFYKESYNKSYLLYFNIDLRLRFVVRFFVKRGPGAHRNMAKTPKVNTP